ncbi:S26 family signal peptidase [Sphingomonas soli]|uniref:S26 family signal peptidase n=1 Tax=Sphingomonas soli TaxID=266127 RepID=UPI0009FFE381|nr:S26 family signal peptidase [Sphingomonas soli]
MTPQESREFARAWRWILAGLACFWATVATIVFPPAPRLIWNASDSAPRGLYRVFPGVAPGRGDMVVAWAPEPWRSLAAGRHYLPSNVPLVKRVAALDGDRVCAIGPAILVNARRVAARSATDGRGRPMPWWEGCRTLKPGEYLLLMPAPASFDGRYFGISREDQLVGKARLLWAR